MRVHSGPPSPVRYMVEGPQFKTEDPDFPMLGTLLWTNEDGMLKTVEVLAYGAVCRLTDPYGPFVNAKRAGLLEYPA